MMMKSTNYFIQVCLDVRKTVCLCNLLKNEKHLMEKSKN